MTERPHRFDRLREDAWDQFIVESAPLAAAHYRTRRSTIEREAGGAWALWIWLLKLVITFFTTTSEPTTHRT